MTMKRKLLLKGERQRWGDGDDFPPPNWRRVSEFWDWLMWKTNHSHFRIDPETGGGR